MKIKRPRQLQGLAWWLCCSILPVAAAFGDSYRLTPQLTPGHTQQVQVVLEVRGELKLNATGREIANLPLEVSAKLQYRERLLELSSEPWQRRSIRYYDEAAANIKAGKGLVNRQLPAAHRLIVSQAKRGESLLYCPLEPLGRDELDLIEIQGNSLLVDGILPQHAVQIATDWEVDADVLAPLFGLEVATETAVTGRLVSVEGDVAVLEFAGRIDGSAGGVASEIELKAKCNFDLQTSRLTWFVASFREKRAIGHAEPGFDVTARLRMILQPDTASDELSDARLAKLPLDDSAAAHLLVYRAQHAQYRLIHDRRWRAMVERPDLTVLRLVDRGDLVAQCNISPLPDAEPGQHLDLDTFRADVARSLGSHFGQVLEATQTTGDDGLRVLRLTVGGMASEIPVQWIYYHFSNDSGQRAAMAFTLESKLVEQFAAADRLLATSFEFTPQPTPQEARRDPDQPGRS